MNTETLGPKTNITKEQKRTFDALTSGLYKNFALMSCFINGEPGAAICVVSDAEDGSGDKLVSPMFVSVTPSVVLTDHEGVEPTREAGSEKTA